MLGKATYLLSTLSEFPKLKNSRGQPLPEIALAGRSNVGKSSLINDFLGQKKLAKTSSTPGKTQLLNFYHIPEKCLFVDLPGYGFAKAPPGEVQKWSRAIDTYLNSSEHLRLVLLLVDIRRLPSEEDLTFVDWARSKQIPILLIFTKTDKLNGKQLEDQLQKAKKMLPCESIPYSVLKRESKLLLQKKIESILWV